MGQLSDYARADAERTRADLREGGRVGTRNSTREPVPDRSVSACISQEIRTGQDVNKRPRRREEMARPTVPRMAR